jgi:hypothetical protein
MIIHDDGMTDVGDEEEIKLPTLVPGIRPAYSTPLPGLPMAVLCIVGQSDHVRYATADETGDAIRAFIRESVYTIYIEDGRRSVMLADIADNQAST